MQQTHTEFVPGRELSRAFYHQVVGPLVAPPHAAAFLGPGSDVLGFDTPRSTDHGWGPRLTVLVREGQVNEVRQAVEQGLPTEFMGWPTRYGWDEVRPDHHVRVTTLDTWLHESLGFDPRQARPVDWLVTPQQVLLELTAGPVFHDELGLETVRAALQWYPEDVWRWLLACQWRRLDQEEPFVGRAAEVGDPLGSSLVAARLVRDLMRLCFLQERRYAPYSKWLGSAYARLKAAEEVPLEDVLREYPARQHALVLACQAVARRQNELGLSLPQEPAPRPFHSRPFLMLGSGRFVQALLARVEDPWLRSLPLIGAIDTLSDSTDVAMVSSRLRALY